MEEEVEEEDAAGADEADKEGADEAEEEDEGAGGTEVRGGGMDGEGMPGEECCVIAEEETSAYGGNNTHINYEA